MPRSTRSVEEQAAPHTRGESPTAPTDTPALTERELAASALPAALLQPEQLRSAIESLLFVAGRPLEFAELRRLLTIDDKRLRAALDSLAIECERAGRGIRVQRQGEQAQLVSAPENARFVAALLGLPTQAKLTTAALETLAVVAYRQPITRSQIEFIRGVNSDRALASLIQYGLVMEVGRAATVGRPALFGTTHEFLGQFGLTSLESLPKPEFPEAEAIELGHASAARRIREAVGSDEERPHATRTTPDTAEATGERE